MTIKPTLALLLALAMAGCATTASRITDDQARFNSYPPAVQEKIRAGEVAPGFTPQMVRTALGEPDRQYQRETTEGKSEIWAYLQSRPSFSLGLGVGSFGGHGGLGGGVGVGLGGNEDEKLRVVFKDGLVSVVERNTATP